MYFNKILEVSFQDVQRITNH